jgi:hypothetical protein
MPSVAEASDEDDTSDSLHFTVADSSSEEKKESGPSVATPAGGIQKSSWAGMEFTSEEAPVSHRIDTRSWLWDHANELLTKCLNHACRVLYEEDLRPTKMVLPTLWAWLYLKLI